MSTLGVKVFKCIHCNMEIEGKKHESGCPYSPVNVKKIVLYLKNYALANSKFNKEFKPFPTAKEFDNFCETNKIMRVVTIRRNYLINEGLAFEDWLTEILEVALNRGIITHVDFPHFLQFLYDSWLFLPKAEYEKKYEAALDYEDGEFVVDGKTSKDLARRLKNYGT